MEYLHSNNIIQASKELLGLYEGIALVDEEKLDDPMDVFPNGIVEELWTHFYNFLEEFLETFHVLEKQEDALIRISQILVERIIHYRENSYISQYEEFEYNTYGLKHFLVELANGEKTARYWDSAIKELALEANETDELELKIAEFIKDGDNWRKVAEKNYKQNPTIAQHLLDFYLEKGKGNDFIRVGIYVFKAWAERFDQYLYDHLEPGEAPDLYAGVLAHYALRERSVALFNEYKKHFGERAARGFIDKLKGKHEGDLKKYYIRLLESEGDHDGILDFVENHRDDWDFIFYIKPILKVYPDECFRIIKIKTDDFLEDHVGRKYYYIAAQWLKLLLNVEDEALRKKIQLYINSLFHVYYRRSALREEFHKAGIRGKA